MEFANSIKALARSGNLCMYYGMRKDDDMQVVFTTPLGYVEITGLRRLSTEGVRVRIVCVWPPLLSYWEELSLFLKSRFQIITGHARISMEGGQRTINLAQKKAGRKPDTDYDQAYQRILEGEDYEDVFRWFCEESKLVNPNEYDRRRFKEAMKRRERSQTMT